MGNADGKLASSIAKMGVCMLVVLAISVLPWTTWSLQVTSRTEAALYINGVRKAYLKANKAVSIETPARNSVLVIVARSWGNGRQVGVSCSTPVRWRASFVSGKIKSRGWATRQVYGGVCLWAFARRVSRNYYRPVGHAKRNEVARFRYVWGGKDEETCGKKVAIVTAAANDRAWLFWNGKHIADVVSKRNVIRVAVVAKRGDVLGIKAMDVKGGGYGVAVDVEYRKKRYVTRGGSKWWRMTGMYKTEDGNELEFLKKGYRNCSWGKPVAADGDGRYVAKWFPFDAGAQYVWAATARAGQNAVFARLVVGEEQCQHAASSRSGQVTYDAPHDCACEMDGGGGRCYYFTDTSTRECEWRRCEPSFACRQNGRMVCVRKHAAERVVPTGHGLCRVDTLPRYVYVPVSSALVG